MGLTFAEIARKKYRSFDRMAEEKAKAHVEVVKYIEGIARTAGVDIHLWDVREIFGTGTGNELEMDRNKVNQMFFENMERLSAAPVTVEEAPRPLLSEAQISAIMEAENKLIQGQIATYTTTRDQRLMQAGEHYRNYEAHIKSAAEADLSRRRLMGERNTLVAQIREADAGGFWEFTGMDGTAGPIKFKTRRNIELEYKNPAIGVDIRVNMGKFQVAYIVHEARFRVTPIENNINVEGFCHPHINSSGEICWGTAEGNARNGIAKGMIVEPLALLAAVISGYNPGSPYRDLVRFHEQVVTPDEQKLIAEMNEAKKVAQDRIVAAMSGKIALIDRVVAPIMPPTARPVEEIVVTPVNAPATPAAAVAAAAPAPATNVTIDF